MPSVVFHFGDEEKEFDLHDSQLDTVEGIKEVVNNMTKKKKRKDIAPMDENDSLDEDEEEEEESYSAMEEIMETGVDAFYSSSGRSITDVVDYHLGRISKILLSIQKQQREQMSRQNY